MGILRGVRALVRRLGYDIVRYYPPDRVASCKIVSTIIEGHPISFFVTHENDAIQKYHLDGRFYEAEELIIIGRYFKPEGVLLDVGSNIGNHAIYAAMILGASKIIAIEPNPEAYRVLLVNATLNGFGERLEHYPVGLSDAPGKAEPHSVRNNMGALSLTASDDGDIRLVTGDEVLRNQKVDFVKIDAERMEVMVLNGLRATIERDRPIMFIEVDDENAVRIDALLDELNYNVVERYRRYTTNENLLAVPTV